MLLACSSRHIAMCHSPLRGPLACLRALRLRDVLCGAAVSAGFAASCKTVFVMALLKNLVAEGHRTLVFSQSRVM